MSAVHPEASPHPSLDERSLVAQLRDRLMQEMPEGIPLDLDTELNLARWIRGYQNNIDRIAKAFPEYVYARRAAGFDHPNHCERFFDLPSIKPYLQYIASSTLNDRVWSEDHNAFLFIERGWSQPKEVWSGKNIAKPCTIRMWRRSEKKGTIEAQFVKAVKESDYLLQCFGYSEMLLQYILRREKRQEANKGPVQCIVIFDLGAMNIYDYLNPVSAHLRLWQQRSDLWQDWYPELVQRVFLVNPPRLISVLWKLVKMFLNDHNCKLIEIIGNKKDLVKRLPPWFVPREFGGEFVNTQPPGDESGASLRRKITPDDHLQFYDIYRKKGIERPKSSHQDIGAESTFTHVVNVPADHALMWDFTSNGYVNFSIHSNDDDHRMVYPRLRLMSAKVPEEGCIEHLPPNDYVFEFHNNSTYFNVKLDFSISVVPL